MGVYMYTSVKGMICPAIHRCKVCLHGPQAMRWYQWCTNGQQRWFVTTATGIIDHSTSQCRGTTTMRPLPPTQAYQLHAASGHPHQGVQAMWGCPEWSVQAFALTTGPYKPFLRRLTRAVC